MMSAYTPPMFISTAFEVVLLVRTEHVTGDISINPFQPRKPETSLKAQTPSCMQQPYRMSRGLDRYRNRFDTGFLTNFITNHAKI